MKRTFCIGLGLLVGVVSSAIAAEQQLTVDPAQSRIEADVKATMGSFVGSLDKYDAKIVVDDAKHVVKSAKIAFKFADFKSGEAKRDRHMHDWQDTEKYPDCRFELLELTGKNGASYMAVGRFTFHGQTQTLTFPVQISNEGTTMVIDGETAIDTQLYGLPIIRKFLALKVDPVVTVRFHLQGKLPAAS